MNAWINKLALCLANGQPQVLVTVGATRGSAPRDAGARMWVGADFIEDTIGGGHLEWKAMAHARAMLTASGPRRDLVRYPLGPGLGQCCGGVVWLVFEYLDKTDAAWCMELAEAQRQGVALQRTVILDGPAARASPHIAPAPPGSEVHLDSASGKFFDVWRTPCRPVVVCGAGHIGQAIVRLLADLPVQVIWLDSRDTCWPSELPANVTAVQGDADDVIDMPDNASWLVLTHNHALDLALIDAVFRYKTFVFMGLIGSRTKKARFVSQLRQRHADALVDQLCCPIGRVRPSDKNPAVIAVSVVAQLLEHMPA